MNENFCQVCYSWYSTVHNTLVTRSTFQKSKNIFKDSTPPLPRPPTHNCLRSHHNRLLEILFRPWTTSLGSHVRYAHASCPRNTTSERSHLTMAAKKSTLDEGSVGEEGTNAEQSNALSSILCKLNSTSSTMATSMKTMEYSLKRSTARPNSEDNIPQKQKKSGERATQHHGASEGPLRAPWRG